MQKLLEILALSKSILACREGVHRKRWKELMALSQCGSVLRHARLMTFVESPMGSMMCTPSGRIGFGLCSCLVSHGCIRLLSLWRWTFQSQRNVSQFKEPGATVGGDVLPIVPCCISVCASGVRTGIDPEIFYQVGLGDTCFGSSRHKCGGVINKILASDLLA